MHSTSLSEFQSGQGIPIAEQIILINNKSLFDGYSPVWYPWSKSEPLKKKGFFYKILRHQRNIEKKLYIPENNNNLFLGYFDKSYDDIHSGLLRLFDLIRRQPHRHFNILIGKGDYEVNDSLCSHIPPNVKRLTANNLNTHHSVVKFLPIGRDFRNLPLIQEFEPSQVKTHLCYCNFSLNTHPIREQIFESIKSKKFLTFDHMGQYLDYPISRSNFLSKLRSSKFCICPRGNAIDTFRVWDCLYLGTIPILVKEAVFHEQLENLPILFLDHHSEFANISKDFLEDTYLSFCEKKFDYSKLKISFWTR